MEGLARAIKLAGSQQALADRINQGLPPEERIGQTAISEWIRRGRVPAEKVIALARAVDFGVAPHDFRGDLYPNPEDGLPAELRPKTLPQEFLVELAGFLTEEEHRELQQRFTLALDAQVGFLRGLEAKYGVDLTEKLIARGLLPRPGTGA